MQNLKNFKKFILESNKDTGVNSRIKEIRRRIEAETGEEKLYQMTYDEGGALQRLIKGAVEGLQKIGNSIADLFDSGKTAGMDVDGLEKNKEKVLSRWGDSIRASGRNKDKDYEDFYKNAILKGRSTFGKGFDINNPEGREQKLYKDYVFSASDYFDVK